MSQAWNFHMRYIYEYMYICIYTHTIICYVLFIHININLRHASSTVPFEHLSNV